MTTDLPKLPVERIVPGKASITFYEDQAGVENLRFWLEVPLEPFDSDLNYTVQPECACFDLPDNNELPVKKSSEIEDRKYVIERDPEDIDGSIYIGEAHNPVDLRSIRFKSLGKHNWEITITLHCDFAYEGVAQPEIITLSAKAQSKDELVQYMEL